MKETNIPIYMTDNIFNISWSIERADYIKHKNSRNHYEIFPIKIEIHAYDSKIFYIFDVIECMPLFMELISKAEQKQSCKITLNRTNDKCEFYIDNIDGKVHFSIFSFNQTLQKLQNDLDILLPAENFIEQLLTLFEEVYAEITINIDYFFIDMPYNAQTCIRFSRVALGNVDYPFLTLCLGNVFAKSWMDITSDGQKPDELFIGEEGFDFFTKIIVDIAPTFDRYDITEITLEDCKKLRDSFINYKKIIENTNSIKDLASYGDYILKPEDTIEILKFMILKLIDTFIYAVDKTIKRNKYSMYIIGI
jgi:hypothetical protein